MDEFQDMSDDEIEELTKTENPNASFIQLVNQQRETINELLSANISSDDSQDQVKVKARKFALAHLESALKTIAELVTGADKDTTRLAAARTIWAIASATSIEDGKDPMTRLFEQIDKRNA